MKFYSEEQVINLLRQQRDLCTLRINGNNCNDWKGTRKNIFTAPQPKLPLHVLDSDHLNGELNIQLGALLRLREQLKQKGLQTRTVLKYQIADLIKLINV